MPREPLPFLQPLFAGPRRIWYGGLVVLWLAVTLWFWIWWLRPEHIENPVGFWLVTALIGWITFLQGFFAFFFLRAVRPSGPDPKPGQYRVAMIVTKTPSEPFHIVRRTLEAMLAQDYPHETWLADEDPSRETRLWCIDNGVYISCRKGVADYHQAQWPRRTRCKEGNLAYFYDHWGYDEYDIVAQLDADHVPQPGYLREMLRPFVDPAVGYVSAPSICASNAQRNWSARTRLHTEGAFHGILQAGYSNGFAPMCKGSHYAVRTAALKSVGGLGPELAEDHSTTMILNAGGWRGVHALNAIAIGEGPVSVADLVTQAFQWSRSLFSLLLQHTPRYLPNLTPRLRAQFLFCQMLYPLFAVTFLAVYLLPIFAVVFDYRYALVTYPDYLAHALPPALVMLIIAASLKFDRFFLPTDARVLSLERVLFVMLQWPWVLWGCVMALRDRLSGRFVDVRITPKGEGAVGRLPGKVLAVYAALAIGCILPVLIFDRVPQAQGFYLLTLMSGALYTLTLAMIVIRHFGESGWRLARFWRDAVGQGALVCAVLGLLGYALTLRAPQSLYALSIGPEPLQLVQVEYRVAGAGGGIAGTVDYRFGISRN
ncbi:glycosyltransferase family 2 protein [Tabrizicola sp.]|uniref:glycosyltransferase family 2 protein n=1 Tax=Tabrizicola sp. TaxID=2005166 RepID=UPI00286CF36B|nr:glycosyltransferase family 2 protein [Tabrizicola sp.]